MKKQHRSNIETIVKYSQKQVRQLKDKTDYRGVDSMSDNEIDYSDIPEKDKTFWAKAKIYDPGLKKAISLKVDEMF